MGCFSNLILVVVALMATSFFYEPANAVGEDVIDEVCRQTEDYDFCYRAFANDPRTRVAADMEALCLLSVAITIDQVQDTSDKIPGLLAQATDPVEKERLTACQSNYEAAVGDFHHAWLSAASKDFADVLYWVKLGANETTSCENIYRSPPLRGCPITVDNQNAGKHVGITLVVLKMLRVSR